MTNEQIEAATIEAMYAQAATVVALDDEDYTYEPVGQERLLLQQRIAELEHELATAYRNLEDAQGDVAEEIKRAELAEAQLACVNDYGAYAETQGLLCSPVLTFDAWYRSPFRNPKAPQP